MYIISSDGLLSVNSTTITSIKVEPITFDDEEMNEKYPEAHGVKAYGKGDKIYLLGIYEDQDRARWKLDWLHTAMKNSEKTFQF